jgi:hypothetical protein
MKYYNLSENIIACNNFLPKQTVEELYTDLLNNRKLFQTSKWSVEEENSKPELFNSNCGGLDFWINNKTFKDNNSFTESLSLWFIHHGLHFYAKNNGALIYEFLLRKLKWDIHVVSYNNGGYYNWHKDEKNNVLFTFNLILNKSNKLKGGKMFFLDRNDIIEIENKNNFMTVFPSYIPHSISPLYTENNKDVAFLEQRFSIQFWIGLQE